MLSFPADAGTSRHRQENGRQQVAHRPSRRRCWGGPPTGPPHASEDGRRGWTTRSSILDESGRQAIGNQPILCIITFPIHVSSGRRLTVAQELQRLLPGCHRPEELCLSGEVRERVAIAGQRTDRPGQDRHGGHRVALAAIRRRRGTAKGHTTTTCLLPADARACRPDTGLCAGLAGRDGFTSPLGREESITRVRQKGQNQG